MNEAVAADYEQSMEIDYGELDGIIEGEFSTDKENLIMILQAIQNRYNYLPQAALAYLAEKIDIPIGQIYAVGTFYKSFSLEPRGRNIIHVCLGTACHVRGGEKVRERIQEILHIPPAGGTTQDMRFTLEPVRCIGCCSLGPVVKINEDIHSRISSDMIQDILAKYE